MTHEPRRSITRRPSNSYGVTTMAAKKSTKKAAAKKPSPKKPATKQAAGKKTATATKKSAAKTPKKATPKNTKPATAKKPASRPKLAKVPSEPDLPEEAFEEGETAQSPPPEAPVAKVETPKIPTPEDLATPAPEMTASPVTSGNVTGQSSPQILDALGPAEGRLDPYRSPSTEATAQDITSVQPMSTKPEPQPVEMKTTGESVDLDGKDVDEEE